MQSLAARAREQAHLTTPSDSQRIVAPEMNPTEPNKRKLPTRAVELAEMLSEAAKSIEVTVPKDKPIVLLGRDAWPLYPLLKAQGRDVQYFFVESITTFRRSNQASMAKGGSSSGPQ